MATGPGNDRDRQTHGTSRIDEVGGAPKKKTNWLPWILGALAILALIFLLSRCNRDERRAEPAPVETNTVNTATATPDVSGEIAAAGTAAAAGAATGNILNDMRTYLASGEQAGRRFSFDDIQFATGSADVPAAAQSTISGLGQLLQSNPKARVRVEGYADARGAAAANRDLGAGRAQAIKAALTGAGVAANRVETGTGGESNPVDTNATSGGRSDNRRTDVVVTAK